MRADPAPVGKLAKATIVVGTGILLFGFYGLFFIDSARTHPPEFFKWFGGGVVAHDALIVPFVALVSVVVKRFVPPFMRAPVQSALFASSIVALTTFPFWRGYGRREDNASVLPNDYTSALLWLVASIWTMAAVWATYRWFKQTRSRVADL